MYNLALHNVRLVDPKNSIDKICNIGIENGKIADITLEPLYTKARTVVDLEQYVALPGVIDIHTHVSSTSGRGVGGTQMLAKAGVCTTLDMSGPNDNVYSCIQNYGSGINVATLEAIIPEQNVSSRDANREEISTVIEEALKKGSLGCKILGGHQPLTLEASQRIVQEANKKDAYVAWHAGTVRNVNNIDSLQDIIDVIDDNKIHIAHINSYCRGFQYPELEEITKALELLQSKPLACSEAYLAATNGTSLKIGKDGHLASKTTGTNLILGGYEDSFQGVIDAIRNGYVHIFAACGIETSIFYKEEAVKLYEQAQGNISGGFNINLPIARTALALAKNNKKEFIVDAISTDGGTIPRNVLVQSGLSLVKMGMLTLAEFAIKTSVNPARMLATPNKGHLALGADADITVVDLETCQPIMTVVNGEVCMWKGFVTNTKGTIITTTQGKTYIEKEYGLNTYIIDPTDILKK